jgi:hypothetical protein
VTPEAAVYLRTVAGVSATRTAWEHTQHMGRFEQFKKACAGLRLALPAAEAEEQIAKLAARLQVTVQE